MKGREMGNNFYYYEPNVYGSGLVGGAVLKLDDSLLVRNFTELEGYFFGYPFCSSGFDGCSGAQKFFTSEEGARVWAGSRLVCDWDAREIYGLSRHPRYSVADREENKKISMHI